MLTLTRRYTGFVVIQAATSGFHTGRRTELIISQDTDGNLCLIYTLNQDFIVIFKCLQNSLFKISGDSTTVNPIVEPCLLGLQPAEEGIPQPVPPGFGFGLRSMGLLNHL